MPESLPRPGIYRHYKGNEYRVIGIAKHSEALDDLVVYQPLYPNPLSDLWVRPLAMFLEQVEYDGTTVARFSFVRA